MTFDPSVRPAEYRKLLRGGPDLYEDSELPRIAVAPQGFSVEIATMWVRSHNELMMLRDLDNSWLLCHFATDNSVQCETFNGLADVHLAASRMREWLDRHDRIAPDDLED